MCNAEEDLRYAERDIARLERLLSEVKDLAGDVDRGIIDTGEFRDRVERAERRSWQASYV